MKLLSFTQIYPSAREPTRGPYNHNIFRAISEICEVRVVAPRPWWSRLKYPQELLTVPKDASRGLDATYPTFWSVPGMARLHGQGMYLSLRSYIKDLRREFPFDAILAAWAYPDAAAAARLADDFDCPLVTKILGSDINELPQLPGLRPLVQRGLGRSQRVVTVSEALRDRVVDLGIPAERVRVQHNGVNGEQFVIRDRAEARERLGLPSDRPLVCYVGRLGHEKGVDVLVEAMGNLRRSGRRDVELLLVGFGEMEGQLRASAAKLEVEDQIRFCGMQQHQDIPDWLTACDVFCLPSRREGCPNVVLEALASGRPVVASRVGGVPELLTSANGIMVPADDAAALAGALNEALLRDWVPQQLRDSVECLSWKDVGRAYYNILVEAHEEWQARSNSTPAKDLLSNARP